MSIDTILQFAFYKNISFLFITPNIYTAEVQTGGSLIIRFRLQVKGYTTSAASARPRIIYNSEVATYQLTHMIDAGSGHVG